MCLVGERIIGFEHAIAEIRRQGGEILCGGKVLDSGAHAKGCFVEPTLVKAKATLPMLQHETFAPILYLVEVNDLDEAISIAARGR